MLNPNDNISFAKWLDSQAEALGLLAIASLRLDSPALAELAKQRYQPEILGGMPNYVLRDQPVKANPASFVPWAKSALVAIGSFRELPAAPTLQSFKLAETGSPVSGLLAGYDLKLDYHIFSRKAMGFLGEALAALAGRELRVESLCDATPIPERLLAIVSGLGYVGLHRCLLPQCSRDGVFICSLLTELELPERKFPEDAASFCNHCGACVSACPNGALAQTEGSPVNFDYSRCIVALSSEFRGVLTLEQAKLLGPWLAGCGECVRECPRTKLPPPVSIDLEWLLTCRASELEKAIAPTSLSYEGATLLRRNALAVLYNQGKKESFDLIVRFRAQTGSAKLREFADLLLSERKQ